MKGMVGLGLIEKKETEKPKIKLTRRNIITPPPNPPEPASDVSLPTDPFSQAIVAAIRKQRNRSFREEYIHLELKDNLKYLSQACTDIFGSVSEEGILEIVDILLEHQQEYPYDSFKLAIKFGDHIKLYNRRKNHG